MKCDLCGKELDAEHCRSYAEVEDSRLCDDCFKMVAATGSEEKEPVTPTVDSEEKNPVTPTAGREEKDAAPPAPREDITVIPPTGTKKKDVPGPVREKEEPATARQSEEKEPVTPVVPGQKTEQRAKSDSTSLTVKIVVAAAIILLLPLASSVKVVVGVLAVAALFGFFIQKTTPADTTSEASPRCKVCGEPLSCFGLCPTCDGEAGLAATRSEAVGRCRRCGEPLSDGLCLTCGLETGSATTTGPQPMSALGCLGNVLLAIIGVALLLFLLLFIVCMGH